MTATNMCSNFGGKWDSPPRDPMGAEKFNMISSLGCFFSMVHDQSLGLPA